MIVEDHFTPELYERSEADVQFIMGKLREAEQAGRTFDDTLIEDIAEARLLKARNDHAYRDGEDPTLATSREIVRACMHIYQNLIDTRKA